MRHSYYCADFSLQHYHPFLAVIMYLGFASTGTVLSGQAINSILDIETPAVGIILFGSLTALLALLGYKYIHVLGRIATITGILAGLPIPRHRASMAYHLNNTSSDLRSLILYKFRFFLFLFQYYSFLEAVRQFLLSAVYVSPRMELSKNYQFPNSGLHFPNH